MAIAGGSGNFDRHCLRDDMVFCVREYVVCVRQSNHSRKQIIPMGQSDIYHFVTYGRRADGSKTIRKSITYKFKLDCAYLGRCYDNHWNCIIGHIPDLGEKR